MKDSSWKLLCNSETRRYGSLTRKKVEEKDEKSRFVVSVRLWQSSAEEKLFDIMTLSGAVLLDGSLAWCISFFFYNCFVSWRMSPIGITLA